MTHAHLALVAALLGAAPVAAQLEAPGAPRMPATPPATLSLDASAAAALVAAGRAPAPGEPFQWAAELPVDAGPEASGTWTVEPDGALVWRLRLASPGAHSIGLEFRDFALPEGAELYAYSDDGREVLGAFTSANNKASRLFAVRPVPGDAVTLEYVQPPHVDGAPALRLTTVLHDFVDLYRTLEVEADAGGVTGGSCQLDVNCPPGSSWQTHKRAVARTLSGGYACSGALLNNTLSDGTQYFLQANHCKSLDNGVFLFGYERSGCGGGSASQSDTVHGSVLIHKAANNDFRMVRISESIPLSYEPYFAGWDRSTAVWTGSVSINHPAADPKEIQVDFGTVQKGPHIWSTFWNQGMAEGGSSGGPLFDSEGRVRGAAWSVSNFNCGAQTTNYGRFDLSWGSIEAFLDPVDTNTTHMDGYDPFLPPPPIPSNELAVHVVTPNVLPSVVVDPLDSPVTLEGTGLADVIEVSVDGVPLPDTFPPSWVVNSSTKITILDWPEPTLLGVVQVGVRDGTKSALAPVTIEFADPPALEVENSVPAFLVSVLPATARVGGRPGSIVFLTVSPDATPSSFPGFVDLDIGAGSSTLFAIASGVVAANGYAEFQFPIGAPPTGATTFWQAAVYDPLSQPGGLPLLTTNVQQTILLF